MTRPEDPGSFGDEADFGPAAEPAAAGDAANPDDRLPAAPEPELPPAGLTAKAARRDDPLFFYLLALALSIGLTALPAGQHHLRLVILWMAIAAWGVLVWLLTDSKRIARETPENLAWGLTFALILAGPLLVFGDSTLGAIGQRLFGQLQAGPVLSMLVFTMPLAETLFFRAVMQQRYAFWLTGLMASLWSILLFLPLLEVTRFPAIGLVVALALLMMNLLYSYVRLRNGLAAAWLCQIGVNLVLLFLPFTASQGF